jgi:hypothetical protein
MVDVSEGQLTAALKQSDRLIDGQVTSVIQSPTSYGSVMSSIFDLEIGYSEDSYGTYPAQCLMKVVSPGMFAMGKAEVEFYQFADAHPGGKPSALVETYGTLIDEEEQSAFILMADEDNALIQSEWPLPPQSLNCRRAVRALAQIHSNWWGDAATKQANKRSPAAQQDAGRLQSCTQALFTKLGDALSPSRRRLVEAVVTQYPSLHQEKLQRSGRQSVVHGDAHLWNFLIPKDPSLEPTLIDWQLWGVDFGVADLAYMIALHWFPDRRVHYERQLVDTYIDELQASGIAYPQEDGWSDYRFMVAGLLTKVVIYASVIPANIWWPHLERAFAAFDDLDCREFIQP